MVVVGAAGLVSASACRRGKKKEVREERENAVGPACKRPNWSAPPTLTWISGSAFARMHFPFPKTYFLAA